MAQELWTAVDEYVAGLLVPPGEGLQRALRASEDGGLPEIQVTPPQGKLLYLLTRLVGAKKVLEFGTLGGYSTIWLARALPPDGRLITLETSAKHAEVARRSIEQAGVAELVELRVGAALDSLTQLESEDVGPFDMTFIDADKVNTPNYFSWALEHARPGALIVADNVVRGGALAEATNPDPAIQAQRDFHQMLATEPRVSATTIQTVGAKGYDGFTIALVNG